MSESDTPPAPGPGSPPDLAPASTTSPTPAPASSNDSPQLSPPVPAPVPAPVPPTNAPPPLPLSSPPAPVHVLPLPPAPESPVVLLLPPTDRTGPPPPAHTSKAAVAAGSASAGATVLRVLAVWLVVVLRNRKRRTAARGDRALEAAATVTTTTPVVGSSKSQLPNSANVIYPLKSPPAGPHAPAPQNHQSLELTPPPTAASSSDYLSSVASGGSSNSKSQHDDRRRGQPVALPAGEVLFRGAFEYGELAAATNGFSGSNLLGCGGFGDVYVGTVDGAAVAVKRLRAGSQQGDSEFQAELQIISRVHHRNLVSLVGYCVADAGQRLLVYEFVPNLTLHRHLHGGVEAVLVWPIRWKIAFGAAKGLAYLHEDCHPRIIHVTSRLQPTSYWTTTSIRRFQILAWRNSYLERTLTLQQGLLELLDTSHQSTPVPASLPRNRTCSRLASCF